MGITNSDLIAEHNALWTTYGQQVLSGSGVPETLSMWCDVSSTDSKVVKGTLIGAAGRPKKVNGAKEFASMRAYQYERSVERYHVGLTHSVADIAGDSSGILKEANANWLRNHGAHAIERLAIEELLANGIGYDGLAQFHATHPHVNGSTQANITTSVASQATVESAIRLMELTADEDGNVLGVTPNLVLCGPKRKKMYIELFQAKSRPSAVTAAGVYDATGSGVAAVMAENLVYEGMGVTVVVSPYITNNKSFLFDTRVAKPFQCRKLIDLQPVVLDKPTDPNVFYQGEIIYDLETYCAFIPGPWQTGYFFNES